MPRASQYQPDVCYDLTATIASGQTVSAAVDLRGCELCGVFLPATFDGTTITLQAAPAIDGTYVAVENGASSAANVTLTATAHSKYVPLAAADRDAMKGLRFIKFVTGTSQTTTDTILTLAVRPQ